MQSTTHGPGKGPSTATRVGFFVAAAVVAVFALLEYAFDWPIHLAR